MAPTVILYLALSLRKIAEPSLFERYHTGPFDGTSLEATAVGSLHGRGANHGPTSGCVQVLFLEACLAPLRARACRHELCARTESDTVKPRENLPSGFLVEITIPIFSSSARASANSRAGGRGIRAENLSVPDRQGRGQNRRSLTMVARGNDHYEEGWQRKIALGANLAQGEPGAKW